MLGTNSSQGGLTRRSFLKTTAAVAGVTTITGLGGCSVSTESNVVGEDVYYRSACQGNCQGGCPLRIKVRDGKVVQVEAAQLPDDIKEYERICIKGLSQPHNVYNPDRIKYPLRRVGERGAGEWERLSWDEALDAIAETWKDIIAKHGAQSIFYALGTGNTGAVNTNSFLKFMAALNFSEIAWLFDQAYLMWPTYITGLGPSYAGNEISDFKNSKVILVWAGNKAITYIQNWHFIAEAIDGGTYTIAIDPNYTETTSKCDRHVALRPGTDGAFALGMCNTIIEEGLVDTAFLKTSTVAPFLVKEDGLFLRQSDLGDSPSEASSEEERVDEFIVMSEDGSTGLVTAIDDPVIEGSFEISGIKVSTAYTLLQERIAPWSSSRAAEICDIPEDEIREIARLFATNTPGGILQGFGYDRYANAHQASFAICTLAALTGNLGRHGSSCGDAMYVFSPVNEAAMKKVPPAYAEAAAEEEEGSGAYWLSQTGLSIPPNEFCKAVETGEFFGQKATPKGIWSFKANLLSSGCPDRLAFLKALEKIDFLVVNEMVMSDTAKYADIVLPVASFMEKDDLQNATINPLLEIMEKAIDPLYECWPEYDICVELSKKMGFDGLFDQTSDEYLNSAFDDSPIAEAYSITMERLKEEKVIRAIGYASDGGPFIHGEGGVFPTSSGRVEFYWENPAPNSNFGQKFDVEKERLPYWEPPAEAWPVGVEGYPANPLGEKYPLMLFNRHTKWRSHSTYCYTPNLRLLDPEPRAFLSVVDAEARGIEEGDTVKVFNDRGHVVLRARLDNGMRPGMVSVPHGWQSDQFIEGHYANLTSSAYNPICVNGCFNDSLVEVEKA